MTKVYEWSKYKCEVKGGDFESDDKILTLTTVIRLMNRFLYKGVDNAILDSEYLRQQKAQKAEHKNTKEGGTHGAKHRTSNSPNKNKARPETGKAKMKFDYVPLERKWLERKYPPGFHFNPSKREIQMMIKKQTVLKPGDEIVYTTMDILEKGN